MVKTSKIAVNDIDINYKEDGSGPPLILLHGLSDDLTIWEPLMSEFSKHYRTIALDLRGHGLSGKPDIPYSIHLFSDDLLVFLEKLYIKQAHLLGFSLGGLIAQLFTLNYPERVLSLILLSTFSHVDPNLQNSFKKLRNSLSKGGFLAFFDEAIKLVVTPEFATTNNNAILEIKEISNKINSSTAILRAIDACLDFDVRDEIFGILCPTLIINGEKDIFTPPYKGVQIHKSVKNSKLTIMEDVGHNLFIPEKITDLTNIVLKFLKKNKNNV